MTFDPFTIIMLAVLAVLIFFMFRNSRKRQAEARELQSKVQPGATVMTNFGVFGTILSTDEAAVSTAAVDGDPEFGERVDETPNDETPDTKKSDD